MSAAIRYVAILSMFLASSCVSELINKYQAPSAAVTQPSHTTKEKVASIYSVDQQTFRFRLAYEQVWDGALGVLLRNYNLNIVDPSSGVITTEWDTFFLNQQVYRNKLSMRVKRLAWDMVEVTIYNNVETLRSNPVDGLSASWLPADNGLQEVGRIVQNMAIAMRQPMPVLPSEMVASRTEKSEQTAQ